MMDASVSPKTNDYSEAALEFSHVVRQHSPQAADCLEQIQADFGTRAGYLAAFALVQLKKRQLESHYPPSQRELYVFTFCKEMRDTPGAMRLYEQAAAHLFVDTEGSSRPDMAGSLAS